MAKRVQPESVGIDVSKDELWLQGDESSPCEVIPNQRREIRAWLRTLPRGSAVAVEATSTYHLELVEQAHRCGHTVYLLDGYRLKHYREGIGGRAKTDWTDARLLRRYLLNERENLRAWEPPPPAYTRIHRLLHRRATLVKTKDALKQSLSDIPELKVSLRALLRQLERLDRRIQLHLKKLAQEAGWAADVQRCQRVEGIGPLTATALTMAFHRGAFRHSDAFIAFLGLDVRVRDSGKHRGKRKLTKKGDRELRRLLYNAAMAAKRSGVWAAFYQRYLHRGLKPIQALVILARKLARVAFALLKNQSTYQPKIA